MAYTVPRVHRGLRLRLRPVPARQQTDCQPRRLVRNRFGCRDDNRAVRRPSRRRRRSDRLPLGARRRRITHLLDDALIPPDFYVVFSGNVQLYRQVYSPGETALTGIQEAADGEFPAVANLYVDRLGRLCFHGRLAKFAPADVAAGASAGAWDFIEWKAGDRAAVDADGTDQTAHIRRFAYNRGLSKIINTALATPWAIADDDIEAQEVRDATSRTQYGARNWSAQSLLTRRHKIDETTALQETKRFATYYVNNYKQPKNRITDIGFRTMHPDWPGASETWNLLSPHRHRRLRRSHRRQPGRRRLHRPNVLRRRHPRNQPAP